MWKCRAGTQLAQSARAGEYTDCTSKEGQNSLNGILRYDTKQSHSEVTVMQELWRMQSNPLLLTRPGPLWLSGVTPDRVLPLKAMGEIEQNALLW